MELAREKGSYSHFKGSDFETGTYFLVSAVTFPLTGRSLPER